MKEEIKKPLIVGGTLALIAGISALLIGLTNSLTASKIVANEENKVTDGLKKVYSNASFGEVVNLENKTYCVSYWTASENGNEIGYVYKTSGKNSYGTVTMLIGINENASLGTIALLTNTETYAGTLEDNYVSPYNSGDSKDSDIEDVSCGATFGAKLVRSMAKEAQADFKERKGL
jgi:hypothetical protein